MIKNRLATEYQMVATATQLVPQNCTANGAKQQAADTRGDVSLLQVIRVTVYLNAVAEGANSVLIDLCQIGDNVVMVGTKYVRLLPSLGNTIANFIENFRRLLQFLRQIDHAYHIAQHVGVLRFALQG